MRMVVLTDFIRREYITTEDIEIDKIGVLLIFKILAKDHQNLNMAVITGSLFVIPKSNAKALQVICNSKEIDTDYLLKEIIYQDITIYRKYFQTTKKMHKVL